MDLWAPNCKGCKKMENTTYQWLQNFAEKVWHQSHNYLQLGQIYHGIHNLPPTNFQQKNYINPNLAFSFIFIF